MPVGPGSVINYDRNATRFASALEDAAEGHALWDPSFIQEHGGVEGDCGYFDGGRFKRLYSIYEPPDNLRIPAIPRPQADEAVLENIVNEDDIILSCESYTVKFGANLQLPPLPNVPVLTVGCDAEHASEQQTLAFLAFCGPLRTICRDFRVKLFENYLLNHGDAVAAAYGATYPVTFNNLVIVFHSVRCISWFSGLKYQDSTWTKVHVEVDILGTGGKAGIERESHHYRIPAKKRGPASWNQGDEPGYSVVLRTVAAKKRGLVKGLVQSVRARVTPGRESKGADPGKSESSSTNPGGGTSMNEPSSQLSGASSSDNIDSKVAEGVTSSNDVSDDLDPELLPDQHDLLDRALEDALHNNPGVDIVVGNWDILLGLGADAIIPERTSLGSFSGQIRRETLGNSVVARLVCDDAPDMASHSTRDKGGMELSSLVLPGAQGLWWDMSMRADKFKHLTAAHLDTSILNDKKVADFSVIIEVPISSNCPDRVIDISRKNKPVTVADVFNAIYADLHQPVDGKEWETSSIAEGIEQAAAQRYKAEGQRSTDDIKPAIIDLFTGKTVFGGLTKRDYDGVTSWALELTARRRSSDLG